MSERIRLRTKKRKALRRRRYAEAFWDRPINLSHKLQRTVRALKKCGLAFAGLSASILNVRGALRSFVEKHRRAEEELRRKQYLDPILWDPPEFEVTDE